MSRLVLLRVEKLIDVDFGLDIMDFDASFAYRIDNAFMR